MFRFGRWNSCRHHEEVMSKMKRLIIRLLEWLLRKLKGEEVQQPAPRPASLPARNSGLSIMNIGGPADFGDDPDRA
jgi:hypothetical protein